MPPIYRSDDGLTGREGADTGALLEAATRVGRHIAGGVSHDLNSALQGLGDALFAIGEDTAALSFDPESAMRLREALNLADNAYTRIAATARAVPSLIPAVADETLPVDLAAELRDIVALTAHNWRYRLDVSVNVDIAMRPFVCRWWIARLAALRMVLIGVQAHPARRHGGNDPLPRLEMGGSEVDDGRIELRMVCDRASVVVGQPASPTSQNGVINDETLLLCADSLGAEVSALPCTPGSFGIAVRFPVRPARAIETEAFQ